MSCLETTQLLRFLAGSLPREDLSVVDEHLDSGASCRQLVGNMLQVRSAAGLTADFAQLTATTSDDEAGSSLARGERYVVYELIGQGGMGQVFRARERLTGDTVALKRVALRATAPHSQGRELLAHEFRTLASLRHPSIISVLDYGFGLDRRPDFTMELLRNVQPILPFSTTASHAMKLNLLMQLLQALAYLHRRRILHRDLKPSEVSSNEKREREICPYVVDERADKRRNLARFKGSPVEH